MTLAAANNASVDDGAKMKGKDVNGAFIGVASFFVAKRAARKLINYWNAHKIIQEKEEGEKKKKEDAEEKQQKDLEKSDMLRRTLTLKRGKTKNLS